MVTIIKIETLVTLIACELIDRGYEGLNLYDKSLHITFIRVFSKYRTQFQAIEGVNFPQSIIDPNGISKRIHMAAINLIKSGVGYHRFTALNNGHSYFCIDPHESNRIRLEACQYINQECRQAVYFTIRAAAIDIANKLLVSVAKV